MTNCRKAHLQGVAPARGGQGRLLDVGDGTKGVDLVTPCGRGGRGARGTAQADRRRHIFRADGIDRRGPMAVMRQETLGRCPSSRSRRDEAIQLQRLNYWLSATVWTRATARGEWSRGGRAGGVNINDMMSNLFAALLMAGWKNLVSRSGGAQPNTCPRKLFDSTIARAVEEVMWYPSPPEGAAGHGSARAAAAHGSGGSASSRRGAQVKCQGAVLRGIGGEWEVERYLDPAREGEVLVKMAVAESATPTTTTPPATAS